MKKIEGPCLHCYATKWAMKAIWSVKLKDRPRIGLCEEHFRLLQPGREFRSSLDNGKWLTEV